MRNIARIILYFIAFISTMVCAMIALGCVFALLTLRGGAHINLTVNEIILIFSCLSISLLISLSAFYLLKRVNAAENY